MTSSWWKSCRTAGSTLAAVAVAAALVTAAHAQDAPAPGAAPDTVAAAPAPATAPPPAAVAPPAAPAPPAVSEKELLRAERAKAREEKRAERAKKRAEKEARAQAEMDEDRKAGRPWVRGANWISLRVGTAMSGVERSPDGSLAFGLGAHHFISRRWAWGLHADVDVLGQYRGSTEMEIPLTAEVSRHFRWGDTFRPYVGAGTGAYYHRTYRTGFDETEVRPGFYLSTGFNSPISAGSLVGVVVRLTVQGDADSVDPIFPNDGSTAVHWSFKLNYLRVQ